MNKLVGAAALLAVLSSGTAVSNADAQTTGTATEWAYCSNENQFCAFTGTVEVRYGATDAYTYRTLTGGTQCTNAVFGDPAYGRPKTCYVRPVASTWTDCAAEGQLCRFTGTRQVRYGADGAYSSRTLTDGGYCTNTVFGDPAPGVLKRCSYGPLAGTSSVLPNGQVSADIGAPEIAGSTTYNAGAYTVDAAGRDIWDTTDQFRFVYQAVTGNVEMIARVNSVSSAHEWSKAGLMVRESLTGASRHVSVFMSASRGYAFQRRPETGGDSLHTAGPPAGPPGWVRLVRTGDLFEAYSSVNGSTWSRFASDTVAMNDTVYVGLAVTSHNAGVATTATVDSLRITTTTAPSNQPPSVSLTAPVNGAQFTAPETVTLTATASDPENRMASVDFYAGSTLVVRDTTAPYSASWSATTAGTVALSAVAHDADGGSTTSSTVNVTVATATNRPPTVSLSTGGTSFTAPATITLTATASDPEGQLARVEFYNGTTRLASDTAAPYTFSWTNVPSGTYGVTAVAYDTAGASATTAAATITVAAATTSTAPRAVVFNASTDHATNVTRYMLKVFAAGANTATATPLATSDLGKPTPASTGEITVDRSTFFAALAAGNYVATVTAIGPAGQTASTTSTFTR